MSENESATKRPRCVAVLGGCGFIGSQVCRALVRAGHRVRVFDKVYADHRLIADIENEVEIIEGDIARPDEVLAVIEPADTVVNLVHTTVPGSSMLDPIYDVETNVVSSVRWLIHLAETDVRKLMFVSSGGTVYGPPRTDLIDESHPTDPISSYGITKLMIEKYVAMYSARAGVEYLILRPSNVYGEGQRLHIGQGVIGVLADRALRGQALEVWGTGRSLRDYLFIDDFTSAFMSLLDYTGHHRTFNVSSGAGHSVLDILAILRNQLEQMPEIIHTPDRGFDVPVNVLDSSRLHKETGWVPGVSLERGIGRVVHWLKREIEQHG